MFPHSCMILHPSMETGSMLGPHPAHSSGCWKRHGESNRMNGMWRDASFSSSPEVCYHTVSLWPQSTSLHWLQRKFKNIAWISLSARQKWISSAVIKWISYQIWSICVPASSKTLQRTVIQNQALCICMQSLVMKTCTQKKNIILFLWLWLDTFRSIVGILNLLGVRIKTVTEIYLVLYPNKMWMINLQKVPV